MAKLQSPTEPPSDAERIAALQVRNAELELELQQVEQKWRKQAEEITENAIALLRTTLEATADGILVINAQGSITHFNHKFAELWKLTQTPTALENDWQLLPLMEVQLKDSQAFLSQVKAEYAQNDLESHGFLEFTDGRLFERYSKPQVLGGEIIGRVISYRDITAWRQAEKALRQSEERFRATFEQAAVGIAHCVKGRFIHANQKCCDILGYTLEELQTLSYINITHPDDLAVELPYAQRLIAGEIPAYSLEKRYMRKDGSTAWINLTTSLVRESSGEIKYATALIEDISERKQAEEQLAASLQEKEVLLKEVHHRVKNNLQVVSSLLDLQSQRIQEPQVLEMFRESQNRVKSMALIHEKLYQSESLSKVNLADYIESLVMYLIQAYAVNPDRIALQLNLEPLALNLDTAIPCGLILNELISNAMKYAFPGNMGGTLWISLHSSCSAVSSQENNVFELVVGNDGVKLPKLLDLSSAKTLGFQLVNILIQQLQGQIEVSQNQGIEFKIRFWEL